MKVDKQEYTVTKVKLELDSKEAAWLKAMLQNPTSENENGQDREFRKHLWSALDQIGIR